MRRPTTKTLARMILNVHGTMDLFTIMKLTLGGWPWLLCCFRAQDWTPTWQAIVSSGLAPLVITIEGYQQMTISQLLSSFIVLQIVYFRRSLLQNMFRNWVIRSYDVIKCILWRHQVTVWRNLCVNQIILFCSACVPASNALKAKNWYLNTITLCFIEKSKQVMVGLWTRIRVSVLVCMTSAAWMNWQRIIAWRTPIRFARDHTGGRR